MDFLILSLH